MVKRPPIKGGRYKEKRIMGGILHNVITQNGKIVEDLGPVKKDQKDQKLEDSNASEDKSTNGLQLVKDDEVRGRSSGITLGEVKKSSKKSKVTWEDILDRIPEPNPDRQEENKDRPNIVFTPIPVDDLDKNKSPLDAELPKEVELEPIKEVELPKEVELEPIKEVELPKEAESLKVELPKEAESLKVELPKEAESLKVELPKEAEPINLPEVPIIPKEAEPIKAEPIKAESLTESLKAEPIKLPEVPIIPKVKINIPKSVQEMPIPGITSMSIKKPDINISGTFQKADNVRPQQVIEKPKPKERKSMAEELEAELLNERKFEEWIKKQKFRENLEKAARFAEETKQQFEEKIPELSEKIEGITGEVKGVENRLGTMDKSVGELCTGVDCIKDDVKKYQESQEALEKLVQDRFQELGEKVQTLEHPTFTCENCGEKVISPLSSFCPNCGSPIHSWSDDSGEPIRGWTPYWKRMGRSTPQ